MNAWVGEWILLYTLHLYLSFLYSLYWGSYSMFVRSEMKLDTIQHTLYLLGISWSFSLLLAYNGFVLCEPVPRGALSSQRAGTKLVLPFPQVPAQRRSLSDGKGSVVLQDSSKWSQAVAWRFVRSASKPLGKGLIVFPTSPPCDSNGAELCEPVL